MHAWRAPRLRPTSSIGRPTRESGIAYQVLGGENAHFIGFRAPLPAAFVGFFRLGAVSGSSRGRPDEAAGHARTWGMRRRAVAIIALAWISVFAVVGVASVSGSAAKSAPRSAPSTNAFRGLGTWVDVYDYGPKFQSSPASRPAVTAASIDDMAHLGVKTVYVQAAQDDTRSDGFLADRKLVGDLLRRAHRRGVKVVAWYLPHFADVNRDLRHIEAMYRFESGHQRFDGIALDLEWTNDVPDATQRNRALLQLATRARRLITRVPLGAIVLEPVLLDDINRAYWPNFPWRQLRSSFDVWLPMSYWTNRSGASGWNDGFRYASENIRRVRAHLGESKAAVHVIGGIADHATPNDDAGFVRAARQRGAIGWSIYDYVTTSSSAWPRLRP